MINDNYLNIVNDKCCNYKNNKTSGRFPNNVVRILPSNNRPIPQYRKWIPKSNRTLPESSSENNLPIKNMPFIDNNEYLYTNNYCIDNSTLVNNWKYSRVFGDKKKIVSSLNPIKHWRRQLIPRQLYYIDELNDNDLNNLLNINSDTNYVNQNRNNNEKIKYIQDYPGAASIINTEYLISLADNWKKLSLQVGCSSDYVLKNIEQEINCETLAIIDSSKSFCGRKVRTSQTNYSYNEYFYENSISYLESRVKLFEQNNTFINLKAVKSFVPFWVNVNKNDDYSNSNDKDFLVSQHLINRNVTCDLLLRCPCYKEISFKPSNTIFTTNNAVSNSNLIIKKKRNVLTNNQYNVTNRWGLDNNSLPIKSRTTPCCKI